MKNSFKIHDNKEFIKYENGKVKKLTYSKKSVIKILLKIAFAILISAILLTVLFISFKINNITSNNNLELTLNNKAEGIHPQNQNTSSPHDVSIDTSIEVQIKSDLKDLEDKEIKKIMNLLEGKSSSITTLPFIEKTKTVKEKLLTFANENNLTESVVLIEESLSLSEQYILNLNPLNSKELKKIISPK